MPKKSKTNVKAKIKPAPKNSPKKKAAPPSGGKSLVSSAQQIWLAGVGAFAKAQQEGSKFFSALAKEGAKLEQSAKKVVTNKTSEAQRSVQSSVSQFSEQVKKIEQTVGEQLTRALKQLEIPSRKEVEQLSQRIDEINREIKALKLRPEPRAQMFINTIRKPRDELNDIAKELEEAQLAARKSGKRLDANAKKAAKASVR